MDVAQLFIWFCIAFVVSLVLVGLNMVAMMWSMRRDGSGFFNLGLNVLFGIVANISALGAIVTGIIWLVQYLKN